MPCGTLSAFTSSIISRIQCARVSTNQRAHTDNHAFRYNQRMTHSTDIVHQHNQCYMCSGFVPQISDRKTFRRRHRINIFGGVPAVARTNGVNPLHLHNRQRQRLTRRHCGGDGQFNRFTHARSRHYLNNNDCSDTVAPLHIDQKSHHLGEHKLPWSFNNQPVSVPNETPIRQAEIIWLRIHWTCS